MKTNFLFVSLLSLALCACSHTPKSSDSSAELTELKESMKEVIQQKVTALKDFHEIREIQILDAQDANGLATIDYQVTYVTKSTETGLVSTSIKAKVTLNKTGERVWTISKLAPQSQSVSFQDATEVVGAKKK